MKYLIHLFCLLFSGTAYAHHNKNHLMLLEDSAQIITATQQGTEGGLFWILWTIAIILLLLGFVRGLKKYR